MSQYSEKYTTFISNISTYNIEGMIKKIGCKI